MTFEELLAVLRERDIRVWVGAGRLNYRAAPDAMTAALLESLCYHKAALVGLLEEAGRTERIEASLPRIPRSADLPLSFAQELLWYLEKLGDGSAAYNIPVALWLDGALDVEALRRALEAIVGRHEVLRTTFAVRGRQPMQCIQPPPALDLPIVDLSHMPEELRKSEVTRLCAEDARIRFDLARDVMLRATLFRLGPMQHVLLLNVHHIAADGWSLGVMYRDLGAFYDAYRKEQEPALDELPVQFADFGAWQRQEIRAETLEGHIAYWKARLAGAPALLMLPTDRPRPEAQTFRGAFEMACFPASLLTAVKALGQREGASLYMVLLAVFQTLLSRYSGQTDIVIGSPVAGRNRVELEQLIGFFVNTLVLRGDLSGAQTFREFLGRTKDTTLEANAHQDLRFERLVDELKPSRNLGYNPIFQVMFSLDDTLTAPAWLGGLSMTVERISSGTSKFDITIFASETAEDLKLLVEYSTDLFDRRTILRMLQDYRDLLSSIVANPDAPIADLRLLAGAGNPGPHALFRAESLALRESGHGAKWT